MSDSLFSILSSIHQETLLQYLDEKQQRNLCYDLTQFNNTYPGGICAYINNAVNLLDDSLSGNKQISGIDVQSFAPFDVDSYWKRFKHWEWRICGVRKGRKRCPSNLLLCHCWRGNWWAPAQQESKTMPDKQPRLRTIVFGTLLLLFPRDRDAVQLYCSHCHYDESRNT